MLGRNRLATTAIGLLLIAGAPAHAQQTVSQAGGSGTAAQPARGSIVFENEDVNLGKVPDGERLTVKFPFRNVGDSPVTILRTKPSCGCTLTKDISNTIIQPGEVGMIEAEFNPTGKKGPSSVRITVETDDPVRPVAVLNLTADVQPIIRVEPIAAQFNDVLKGESRTLTLELSGEMDGLRALFATATDSTKIDTRVVRTWKDPQTRKSRTAIEVALKPQVQTGQLRERIYIRTNDPRRRLVDVAVLANIVGDLQVSPNRIGLGLIVPGQEFTKQTRITHRTGEPFKITDALVRLENMPEGVLETDVEIVPAEDAPEGTAYDVIVHGFPAERNAQRRAVRGVLLVKTDIPGEETIEVLMYGSMRSVPNVPTQTPRPAPRTPAGGGGG